MANAKSKPGSLPQGFNVGHFVLLLVVIVVCVFPFYWMVTTSFKDQSAILSPTPQIFFNPTLGNYTTAFQKFDIRASLVNSLIVALSTTAISLILGAPAAYAIARFEFKGKRDLWFWFISNRMISPIVVALPFFLIARQFRLLDTQLALILIYLTFNVPIVVWICADQFRNIPKELDEAATLEGYNSFAIFWRIALPLATPGIAVSAIFQFHLFLERTSLRVGAHPDEREDRPGCRDEFSERLRTAMGPDHGDRHIGRVAGHNFQHHRVPPTRSRPHDGSNQVDSRRTVPSKNRDRRLQIRNSVRSQKA